MSARAALTLTFVFFASPALAQDTELNQLQVLDHLVREVNAEYGFVKEEFNHPAINTGPCADFAKIFHDEWNRAFETKVKIAFVFMGQTGRARTFAAHTLIKLPDEAAFPDANFFDGGVGFRTKAQLVELYKMDYNGKRFTPVVEVMDVYDEQALIKNARGLNRTYKTIDFSWTKTEKIVRRHIEAIKKFRTDAIAPAKKPPARAKGKGRSQAR